LLKESHMSRRKLIGVALATTTLLAFGATVAAAGSPAVPPPIMDATELAQRATAQGFAGPDPLMAWVQHCLATQGIRSELDEATGGLRGGEPDQVTACVKQLATGPAPRR
jgi:hypothetical protein